MRFYPMTSGLRFFAVTICYNPTLLQFDSAIRFYTLEEKRDLRLQTIDIFEYACYQLSHYGQAEGIVDR